MDVTASSDSSSGLRPISAHAAPAPAGLSLKPGLNRSAVSMSESLAMGLVNHLADLANHMAAKAVEHPLPNPTIKRAAAFRAARQYILDSAPKALHVASFSGGAADGKDKKAWFVLLHWDCASSDRYVPASAKQPGERLVLVLSVVDARSIEVRGMPLLDVSRHALMRIFYRLKTTDPMVALGELNQAARALYAHSRLLRGLGPSASILVPSSRGAIVVARDRFSPDRSIVKTWMNDERMEDNKRRRHAVAVARAENGVVVNHLGAFPIISWPRADAALHKYGPKTFEGLLNTICDEAFPANARLPADWRFRRPGEMDSTQAEAESDSSQVAQELIVASDEDGTRPSHRQRA